MSHLTIAHVLSSFGLGGQERVAVDLAKAQRSEGHQVIAVSLAASGEGPIATAFRRAGVEIETVTKHHAVDVTLPLRIASHLTGWRVDVVHTHNPHALIYGAPAARLLRAAAVHSKHGINPDRARRVWLRRAAAKLVDAYVAVTPSLAKIAIQNRECEPDRLRVIPNGIDTATYAPDPWARLRVRKELGIPEDAWLVGTVGRLAPEKDQGLLIDAMKELLHARCRLLIVGAGPELEALRSRALATGRTEFIHLVGERDDVPQLLAALDVFALTSRSEGLPLVLLEAMATGLPVLSTAVGGIPDLIAHRVTGFLTSPDDLAALSKHLRWLSSRPYQAFEVANAGREFVLTRHSVSRMAQAYESLYRRVGSARRSSTSAALGAQHGG
jgi:glycosyltransferase involved in cell wall biosynthesis